MPERRPGHRIGHHRLDVFLALRAVVAMNRVLGNDRLDLFVDVLELQAIFHIAARFSGERLRTDTHPHLGPSSNRFFRFSKTRGQAAEKYSYT